MGIRFEAMAGITQEAVLDALVATGSMKAAPAVIARACLEDLSHP